MGFLDPKPPTRTELNATIATQVTEAIAAQPSAGVAAASVVPSGYRTIIMGDSITAYNGGFSTATPTQATGVSYSSAGMHRWANVALGQWLDIIGNSGIGGNESGQILARFQTDVLAYKPDIVTILAGSNDEPEDATIDNLEAMYKLALDAGITVVAHTIPPTTTGVAGIEAHRLAVNEWIREYAATTPGIILADIGPAWQDTTKPGYIVDPKYVHDGVHPNTLGGQTAGAVIARALKMRLAPPLKGTNAAFAPYNLLTNPRFTGTGTNLPTGWVQAGGSATYSYLPNPDGPGQQLVVTVPAGGFVSLSADAPVNNADVRIGDSLEFSVKFRCWDLEVTTTNSQRMSARIQQWNGTSFHSTASDVYIDGGANYGSARYPFAEGAFRTPKVNVIAGTTIAQAVVSINGGGVYVLNEPTMKNHTGIAAGRLAGEEVPHTNLVPNPGFETDLTGWEVVNGATMTRTTAEKRTGTASMQLVHAAATNSAAKVTPHIAITPSLATTARVWVKAPVGHAVRLNAHLYTASAYSTAQFVSVTGTGAWQEVKRTFTPGADITRCILEVLKDTASAADTATVYVDDADLWQG